MKTTDFLDEFIVELKKQLETDAERWGDSWLCSAEGQEKYCIWKFIEYYNKFLNTEESMPWLKIAGYALICWIRENHPEILSEEPCFDPGRLSLEGS